MILIEDDSIPIPNNDKEIFQEIIIFSQHFPKHNWSTDPLKPHRNLPPLPAFGGLGSLETGGSAWPGGAGLLAEGVEEAPK